jgi:hypothetical protein
VCSFARESVPLLASLFLAYYLPVSVPVWTIISPNLRVCTRGSSTPRIELGKSKATALFSQLRLCERLGVSLRQRTPDFFPALPAMARPMAQRGGDSAYTFADDLGLDVAFEDTGVNSHAFHASSSPAPSQQQHQFPHQSSAYYHPSNPHHQLHNSTSTSSTSASATSSTFQSLISQSTADTKLELSPQDGAVRRGVLQEAYFPTWKDDTASGGLESPEEMQQKDPLATQVWKLYSKAKSQLPNAERMENLTWRMMSMNLRRLELERKGLVTTRVDSLIHNAVCIDSIVLTVYLPQGPETRDRQHERSRPAGQWHCSIEKGLGPLDALHSASHPHGQQRPNEPRRLHPPDLNWHARGPVALPFRREDGQLVGLGHSHPQAKPTAQRRFAHFARIGAVEAWKYSA